MFGRKRQQIRQMGAEIRLLKKSLAKATRRAEDFEGLFVEWHRRAERFSDDRVAGARRETRLKLDLAARDLRIADLEAQLKAAAPAPQLRPAA
jgi:hypothetical protein